MSSWPRRRRLGSLGVSERSAVEAATGGSGGTAASGGGTVTARHGGHEPATADAAWREAHAAASFDARLQLFPLVMHGATQATTLLGWRSMPAAEIAQRVVSTLTVALFWALPTFWPVPYMRHRTVCLLASRISFFAWPLLRKPRGIQSVLDTAAGAGTRGVLRDVIKILWGGRLVAVILLSSITPLSILPLCAHLMLQLYAVLMVRGNSSLCAAPLLRDQLTQERIRAFHSVVGLGACVLPGGVGFALRARLNEGTSTTAQCEAFLTFLSVVLALLLPAYIAVKTEPPTPLQQREQVQLARAGSEGAASIASTTDTALDARQDCAWGGCSPSSAASWLAGCEATLGTSIRYVFCGPSWLARPQPPTTGAAGTAGAAGAAASGRPRRQLYWYERLTAWVLLLALVYEIAVVTAHVG